MQKEFEVIKKIIAEKMDIDESSIKMDSSLQDLQIDSLDMVEIIMSVEEELGVSLEEVTNVEKISDLLDFIKDKQA